MGDLELKGLQRNPIELYNEEEEQESYENTTHHHKYAYYRNYLILICLIFSLSAMQYGFTQVKLNTILIIISIIHGFNPYSELWLVIAAPLGGIFGALFVAQIAGIGKRKCIHIANLINIIGCSLNLVNNYWMFVISLFINGFAVGIHITICPLAIKEQVPVEKAGAYVCLVYIFICFGVLVCCMLCLFIIEADTSSAAIAEESYTWKLIMTFPMIICGLQSFLICLYIKHETPKFYVQKGDYETAEVVLGIMFVYPERIHHELSELEFCNDREKWKGEVTWKELFSIEYRRALITGVLLIISEQLTGIGCINNNSIQIFTGHLNSLYTKGILDAVYSGIAALLCAILGVYLILKLGRRTIAIIGFSILMPITLAGGIGEVQSVYSHWDYLLIRISWTIYLSAFALTIGNVFIVYCSEILPIKGYSVVIVVHQILALVIQFTTSRCIRYLQLHVLIFCFLGFLPFALLFAIYMIKETKGQTEREIKYLFTPSGFASIHRESLHYF